MPTLYDSLNPADSSKTLNTESQTPFEHLSGKEFADAVLSSEEFRKYIKQGLALRDLAPAIVTRLMDYGWGKPPDRVEHTGKNGQPIETITEVRRVIVHTERHVLDDLEAAEAPLSITKH